MQRDTDGHTAVIGHHRQEEALSGSEDKEEAHLCGTVQDRYSSVLSPKVHQNPRESDGHIADFQGGKICMGFCSAGSSLVSIMKRPFPIKIMM